MIEQTIMLRVGDAMKQITIKVDLIDLTQFKFRCWLGLVLMRLGVKIMGMNFIKVTRASGTETTLGP